MSDTDPGCQARHRVGADRVHEVRDVLFLATARGAGPFRDQRVGLVEYPIASVSIDLERAAVAIEGHKPRTMAVTAQAGPHDLTAVEVEAYGLGVGRLLVVIEPVSPARRGHPAWQFHPESPGTEIDSMDTVVAQLTVAVVPEPMPVVWNQVRTIRSARDRSLPGVVVEARWGLRDRAPADAATLVVVPTPGGKNIADHAVLNPLDRIPHGRTTSPLGAHLDDPAVFFGGRNHPDTFLGRLAARLFHVDMLAGLTCLDRGSRMPVVGCRADKSIDLPIVENPPVVSREVGLDVDFFQASGGPFAAVSIHIAQVFDDDTWRRCKAFSQARTSLEPHHSDDHPLPGRCSGGSHQRDGGCGSRDQHAATRQASPPQAGMADPCRIECHVLGSWAAVSNDRG